jgi:hypothetical protein
LPVIRLPEERAWGWHSEAALDRDYRNKNYRETKGKVMEAHGAMLRRLALVGEGKIFFRVKFRANRSDGVCETTGPRTTGQQDDGEVRTPKAICFSAGNDTSILKGITHYAFCVTHDA